MSKPKAVEDEVFDDAAAIAEAEEAQALAAEQEEVDDHAYLGREFLTWLLYRVDTGHASFDGEAGACSFGFGARAKLAAAVGFATEVTVKGKCPAAGAEVRAAIGSGHTLREAELLVRSGDQEWKCVLVADTLDLRGVKLPQVTDKADSAIDNDPAGEREIILADRLALLDALEAHVRAAYGAFLGERLAPRWRAKVVPALREWLVDGLAVGRA
jgi:hypothetical protein